MPRTAKLRTRILIKDRAREKDAGGGYSEKLVTIAQVWAEVKTTGGAQAYQAGVRMSEGIYEITVRKNPAIRGNMFVELPANGRDRAPQLRILDTPRDLDESGVYTVLICQDYKDGEGGR